jgi:hypothetical protein
LREFVSSFSRKRSQKRGSATFYTTFWLIFGVAKFWESSLLLQSRINAFASFELFMYNFLGAEFLEPSLLLQSRTNAFASFLEKKNSTMLKAKIQLCSIPNF